MTRRFGTRLRRPLRLEGFSVFSRVLRHAAYSEDMPPTQAAFWILLHDLSASLKAGRSEWLYNDRLHVTFEDREIAVSVDMRNSQFIGVDRSLAAFALGYKPDIGLAIDLLTPDDGVLVDVGANWGYFPIFLGVRPGFSGRVLALEPFPRSFQSLSRTLGALGLPSRVEAVALAAGREAGFATMTDEVFSGDNRLVEEEGAVRVQRATVDELLQQRTLGRVDFLKISVEGAEGDVLAGAERTIKDFAPAVMFEDRIGEGGVSPALAEIARLGDYRFHVLNVSKAPARGQAEDDVNAPLVDCLVDVWEITPAERGKWPDRINVLAVPASVDVLDRLAAREPRDAD